MAMNRPHGENSNAWTPAPVVDITHLKTGLLDATDAPFAVAGGALFLVFNA